METVNCISNQKLTEIENEVYIFVLPMLKLMEKTVDFVYDETDYESLGITLEQMKGYLGQTLSRRDIITACEGCYFTHFYSSE